MSDLKEGEELFAAVNWWQNKSYMHPMTCGEHSDRSLEAFLCDGSQKVYLYCPVEGCKYSQTWIPDVVLKAYRKRPQSINGDAPPS